MRTIALLYHDVVPAGDYSLSGFQSADANIYKLDCDEFKNHLREIARSPSNQREVDRMRSNWAGPD